jgi:hypothetical protein
MSTDAGHPYGTLRLGAVVIAASFAVLALLGVSGRAVASSSNPAPGAPSAGAVVAEARAAMARAGSVSAQGAGATTLPGVGRATLTETDYAGPTSGSQQLSTTSPGVRPDRLPSADTVDVSGAVYVNADAPFWTASVGMATASATPIAGRWVRIPGSSPAYADAAADLTMPSLIHDLFHASHYELSGVRTVDGERVVTLTGHNSGNDAGPVTVDVSLGGSHLPVLVTIGGLSLHLGAWGRTQPLVVPAGSIPMPDLDGTTPSGLPAVA